MVQTNSSGVLKPDDQKWLAIIQRCRTSGMSDRDWCEQNDINKSTFYYHLRRLRKKACEIPAPSTSLVHTNQEVVQVCFESPAAAVDEHPVLKLSSAESSQAAIHLEFHGFHLAITNSAASETIINTISALQKLC